MSEAAIPHEAAEVVGGNVPPYPECQFLEKGSPLDETFRSMWATLNGVPPEVIAERKARADAVARESAKHAQELEAKAKPKVTADTEFTKAFDDALEKARGLQRREACRVVAKATARFFVNSVDGRVVDRLAGLYQRHGSERSRSAGAELAREVAADPARFGNPLSVFDHRCGRAAA